jgi:parallel beta-helix repeat protein
MTRHPAFFTIALRTLVAGGLEVLSSAAGAVYHVDPASGSMSHPGTVAQPWSTLEAVFAADKSFAAGDEIVLRNGYHGAPTVKGSNAGNVTIRPDSGASPKLRSLLVKSGARWVIEGLDISPGHDLSGAAFSGTIVDIESSASRITLRDCIVRTALTTAGWSLDDWKTRPKRGIRNAASNTTLSGNLVETTSFGITVRKAGSFTLVSGNLVKGFSHDGIQALADDCEFESNIVTDAYVSDNSHNHDDFFQGWSVGADGFTTGEGTIFRVTLRGNKFISRTDPEQPFASNPQGIGCFDGYYEGWVIENNLIASRTSHGIALYGAIDCKVVNNTVVENPLDAPGGSTRPWIKIAAHKTRGATSSGNLIRNNISAKPVEVVAGSSTVDFHQTTTAYSSYFVNPAGFDYSLKATAPARDAGSSQQAPAIDIAGVSRVTPYDLGAHEFRVVTGTTYAQWLAANGLPPDGSGDGAPDADPLGDRVSNEMKFALGLAVNVRGHGGRMTTSVHTTGGQRYLSLAFTHPDPAPSGASYQVQTTAGLAGWSGASTVVVSDTVAGGLRTRVVRDVVPIGGAAARRFIRLVVDAP